MKYYYNIIPIYLLGHVIRIWNTLQVSNYLPLNRLIEFIQNDYSYILYIDSVQMIKVLKENLKLKQQLVNEENDKDEDIISLTWEEWLEFNILFSYPITYPYISFQVQYYLCKSELENDRIWYSAALIGNIIEQCNILYPKLSLMRIKCYQLYSEYLNIEYLTLYEKEKKIINQYSNEITSIQKKDILHLAYEIREKNNCNNYYGNNRRNNNNNNKRHIRMNEAILMAEQIYLSNNKDTVIDQIFTNNNNKESIKYFKLCVNETKKLFNENNDNNNNNNNNSNRNTINFFLANLYIELAEIISIYNKREGLRYYCFAFNLCLSNYSSSSKNELFIFKSPVINQPIIFYLYHCLGKIEYSLKYYYSAAEHYTMIAEYLTNIFTNFESDLNKFDDYCITYLNNIEDTYNYWVKAGECYMNINSRSNSIYCYENAVKIVNLLYNENNEYEIDCYKILADLYYPIDKNKCLEILIKCQNAWKVLYGTDSHFYNHLTQLIESFCIQTPDRQIKNNFY